MVPEALAGRGSRSADLGVHGKRAARRAFGLEGALIDREPHTIAALDPSDHRTVTMNVAGPGALLVAKLQKLWERTTNEDRVKDKDALDVFRILRAIPTEDLARRMALLRTSDEAGTVAESAISQLRELFGARSGRGIELGIQASARLIATVQVLISVRDMRFEAGCAERLSQQGRVLRLTHEDRAGARPPTALIRCGPPRPGR